MTSEKSGTENVKADALRFFSELAIDFPEVGSSIPYVEEDLMNLRRRELEHMNMAVASLLGEKNRQNKSNFTLEEVTSIVNEYLYVLGLKPLIDNIREKQLRAQNFMVVLKRRARIEEIERERKALALLENENRERNNSAYGMVLFRDIMRTHVSLLEGNLRIEDIEDIGIERQKGRDLLEIAERQARIEELNEEMRILQEENQASREVDPDLHSMAVIKEISKDLAFIVEHADSDTRNIANKLTLIEKFTKVSFTQEKLEKHIVAWKDIYTKLGSFLNDTEPKAETGISLVEDDENCETCNLRAAGICPGN